MQPPAVPDSTTSVLAESNLKVVAAARALQIEMTINLSDVPTRTAEEAAIACACNVAQIVKSLVFRGKSSGEALLLLVSGANRVNEKAVSALVGEALSRPDADFVREVTGFAIGGIPPFGHKTSLRTFMDQELLKFDAVWAAAGTPNSTFSIDPRQLHLATQARILRMV